MNEESLFAAALEKADPTQRQAFLTGACGGDDALRQRVERLLAADEHAGGVLDRGADGDFALGQRPLSDPPSIAEGPGTVIGRYKLKEQIGEGGFGLVFVAEQQEPIRRMVALKLIKPGMDTREVIARFEAERQALALMDHPNIAHVIDAGATESGRPYFVMELVRGVAITEYCDQSQLTTRERLELFISVCQAVQHAHQKGIIHRDLKPSNVLVTLHDGRPVVKVIDFGVAKALNQQLTERSVYTRFAQMVGTPLYMSPEQAEMSGLDVDTRADIYSLGVLLYELLTGTTPFDKERLKTAAFDEIRRIIREEEPPKPSRRITILGQAATTVSANRKSDPRRLSRSLRGELDWIVMKALEKDRTRRYETASGMARDVQRYLRDEPVEASPPSTVYRLRKFLRRNRGPVLAASVIFLLLVGGVIGTTIGLVRERRAKESAQKRLAQIEKGIDVLSSIFEDLDPKWEEKEGRPLRAILGDRLDRAAAELEAEAVGDPLVVAKLQDRLGATYLGLGCADKAAPLLTKALATRETQLGRDHADTHTSRNNLAVCLRRAGNLDQALLLHEETLRLRRALLGADHVDTLTSMNNLSLTWQAAGQLDRALPLYEETLASMTAKRGPFHVDTLSSMANLASAYLAAGKLDQALPLCAETLKLQQKHLGPRHIHTLFTMNTLAQAYQADRKLDRALPLFKKTLELRQATLGPYHLHTLVSMSNLAECYRAANQLALALPLHEESFKVLKSMKGPTDPDTLLSMNNLAATYWQADQLDRSVPLFEEVYRLMKTKHGENHPAPLLALANLGVNYKSAGRLPQAVDCLEEALTRISQLPELSRARFSFVPRQLVDGYEKSKLFAKAEPLRREALAAAKEKAGPESVAYAGELMGLGSNLLAQQKYAEAEPLLVRACEGMKQWEAKNPTPGKIRLTEALERLVQLYEGWGKPAEAAKWRAEQANCGNPARVPGKK